MHDEGIDAIIKDEDNHVQSMDLSSEFPEVLSLEDRGSRTTQGVGEGSMARLLSD